MSSTTEDVYNVYVPNMNESTYHYSKENITFSDIS